MWHCESEPPWYPSRDTSRKTPQRASTHRHHREWNACPEVDGQRPVTLLSNTHDDSMICKARWSRPAPGGREEIQKPHVVDQYNCFMGGVDKSDQLLCYYAFSHRTVKWWRRLFYHLLQVAIVNAYIMYSETNQSGRKLDHEAFRVRLATELLAQAATDPPTP